jgi:hypothetical protein
MFVLASLKTLGRLKVSDMGLLETTARHMLATCGSITRVRGYRWGGSGGSFTLQRS